MKINSIKPNPSNPRLIKDAKFLKLVQSIKEFPAMMALRPMVVNKDNEILGGNMRFKALKELNYKDIPEEWVKRAEDLTEDEARRFIIADNVGFGENDWDVLANEWDTEELEAWGLDIPVWQDFSDKNKEIDIDALDTEMTINLKYSETDYNKVKEALSRINASPEQAVYKLLNL